jgi:hypothetical protein
VVFADRSGDAFLRMVGRTALADALHQAGRRAEALARFREAEAMQAEDQPNYPLLYSLRGFQYCDLLLADAERAAWRVVMGASSRLDDAGSPGSQRADDGLPAACRSVKEQASQTLAWAEENNAPLLDFALNNLSLGRAGVHAVLLERGLVNASAEPTAKNPPETNCAPVPTAPPIVPESSALAGPRAEIEQAVDGLRRGGDIEFIGRGLLTRAWLRSLSADAAGAWVDLDEAWEIAERGAMPLFLADVHLHRARLFHGVTPYPWAGGPRADLAAARRLIEKHGYGRRLGELEDAEEAAEGW